MDDDATQHAYALINQALGNWWTDDRRNWCAYCGIKMSKKATKGSPIPLTAFTRDHVIPRKHKGGLVTIPACRACNKAKGTLSLQEFLIIDHFVRRRKHRNGNQWPIDRLWLVTAAAALKGSLALLETANKRNADSAREIPAKSTVSMHRPDGIASVVDRSAADSKTVAENRWLTGPSLSGSRN